MKFKAILADPPTQFQTYSGPRVPSRAADQPYKTIPWQELMYLRVAELADKDCILFLWVTWPTLLLSLRLAEKWGFTYKTIGFNWVKRTKNGKWAMGGGYWTRSNSEVCLIFTKGKPKRLDKGVRQVVEAPRGKAHSAKPPEVHERIEKLVAGPYLELFGRNEREGWVVIGNEVDSERLDITESIRKLIQEDSNGG